jgi:heterodisulfide reductase subunit C2
VNATNSTASRSWVFPASIAAVLWALGAIFIYVAYTSEQGRAVNGVFAILVLVLALVVSVVAGRALKPSPRLQPALYTGEQGAGTDLPIQWGGSELMREVERRSQTKLSACYQCHKCSSGCPVGQDAEFLSSQIMRLIHLGAEREVLTSRAIWLCASCHACSARCPMGVDVAAVMDTLRMMAIERGAVNGQSRSHLFGLSFLNSVRRHGRAHELGLMAAYKLRSGDLFSDMDKAPKMFSKGKLSIFPKRNPNATRVREVFKRSISEEAEQ